ncbi:MAG: tail fiber domain-containing protein, partial [Candidatus Paceibacterota bacterium]
MKILLIKFLEKHFLKIFSIFVIFFSLLSPFYTSEAAINKQINYQGKLTDGDGVAVPDGTYNMEFILYDDPDLGGAHILWTETRIQANRVTVTSGLFSILLGEVTALTSVNFNQTLYLGVNIGGTADTATPTWDGEMVPRKKLGVVPAAVVSEKVINIIGGNGTTLLGSIPYQSDTDTTTLLAPNTTTTKKFLRMTGDGTNGAVPAWDTLVDGDIPSALTGKTYNGLTITANGTNTLNITAGKTLTVQDNVTITGALGTGAYATIADYAPVGQTMYIGTTAVAINRASAALALTGITGITPATDFTLTQNSVVPFTSVESGAVVNTLYLKAGNVGIGTTTPTSKLTISSGGEESGILEGFENETFPPTDWTTGGNVNWARDTSTKYAGTASAASGTITHSQTSWLDVDYTFSAAGSISFYWKVSSETNYDFLLFCLDNDSCTRTTGYYSRISGEVDWVLVSVPVSAGVHSFRWLYGKDTSDSSGSDKGWVDNVVFSEGISMVDIEYDSNSIFNIASSGNSYFTGNLGIGDTTPDGKLDIEPTGAVTTAAGATALTISNLTTNADTALTKYGAYITSTGTFTGGANTTVNYGLYVNSVSGADTNYGAYIAGNVGIGTTVPASLLQVGSWNASWDSSGNVPVVAIMGSGLSTSSQTLLRLNRPSVDGNYYNGDVDFNVYSYASPSGYYPFTQLDIALKAASSGVETADVTVISLRDNGNVGIGDTSPDALLDVKGTVCLDLNADDVCTDNTAAISDARLKTNVTNITNGLQLVQQLRPVRFTWNGENYTGTGNSLGFLAQEVETIFPELIITDTAGYKNLDYAKLTAVLASAIQELDLKISDFSKGQIVSSPNTFGEYASAFFGDVIQKVEGGIAYMKALVVDTLKIGSPQKRTGVTLYDEITGEPYCLSIADGIAKTTVGECIVVEPQSTPTTPTEPIEPEAPIESTDETTEPTAPIEPTESTTPTEPIEPGAPIEPT